MLLTKARIKLARLLYEYIQYKYGKKSDICVVAVKNGDIAYSTSAINGFEDSKLDGKKLCLNIRSKCGQQMLNTYGLTPPGKDIPVLALFPTLSLLREIGIKNFIVFIVNWYGESKVGQVTVIKYIVLKDINNGL
jgi:hypothetical protein